jgi:SpoU rRNA methylase family enzyme
MKAFRAALAALLISGGITLAANITPTPVVPPNETGENSAASQQILDMARFKPGFCTVTTAGSEAAQTGTCNGASGLITSGFSITVISNAKDLMTITNNKVQAGDLCIAMIDDTGAAAASVPEVASCRVTAGQIVLVITNASATSPAAALKAMFLIITQGNPN